MGKILSPKAFKILLSASIASLCIMLMNTVINFTTLDAQIALQMEGIGSQLSGSGVSAESVEAFVRQIVIFSLFFGFVIFGVIYGLFIMYLFKHKKSAAKGTYLTVMFVLAILQLAGNGLSLITALPSGNFLFIAQALVGVVPPIMVLVGHSIQKNYVPPVTNTSNDQPYGY